MFKSSSPRKKKSTAQAMVEFALALPVLLLVVYGLIETGRLLFIYASVVTAARQGSRYGSATGTNAGGTPYYKDCTGITAAINSVAFINPFTNATITYDGGLDTSGKPIPLTGSPACPGTPPNTIQNGYRINVQVSGQYSPIVPLVPFTAYTITSMSSRTMLGSISIGVTSPAQVYTGSGGVSLQVSSNVTTYTFVGQAITFTYTLSNTSAGNLTSPYVVVDSLASGENCSGATSPLAPGASTGCTGGYTITQADMDNGSISGTAFATASGNTSNSVNTTLLGNQTPSLLLTKTSSVQAAPTLGQTVTYTYTLKNTGNVTLVPPFAVTDNKVASTTCASMPATLAPNATGTCTGTYQITSADITAGFVTNTATATAVFATKTITSNSSSATVGTRALFLSISASPMTVPGLGQVISYTYTLKNAGSSTMNAAYAVADAMVTGITCPGGSLAVGNTLNCTGGTHTTTQADVDAGVVTDNATATANGGGITSNPVSASIIVTQTLGVTLTISPSPNAPSPGPDSTVGQVETYTYTVKNTGNVTLLSPFTVADDRVTPVSCAGATSPLAPGASTTCTGTYTTTQADLDAGSIIDHATVTATTSKGLNVTSAPATSTVITHSGARLGLQKSANPTATTGAGQVITYTYTLKNTGNTPLTSPFTVSDDHIGTPPGTAFNCAATSPIPVGGASTCTATYTTNSTDFGAGLVKNTATATSLTSGTPYTSNSSSVTVPVGLRACDPRHSSLKTAPFGMTVFNESASSTITISQIQIYYNATHPSDQFIFTISYGGVTVWAGGSSGSPGVFTAFSGDVTLAAGSNKQISLLFHDNYIVDGSERILINFAEPGCPTLDSTDNSQLP
jgi:uncharacterized repeat protein (TIGR01451 family)